MTTLKRAEFSPGRLAATPGALQAFRDAGDPAMGIGLLRRHLGGDWGELAAEDKDANDEAVKRGRRILSAYKIGTGVKVWVITEADRSATTFLLPEEY
jgi:hypothetical protein